MKTDRDLSIERLLRRSRQAPGPPCGDCPDAEALAAFADDTLLPAERQIVEAHVADCHGCQALTAALMRTMPGSTLPAIPPGARDDRAASPWWKRRSTLNWLVPATAAAAALILWVAVPDQRSPASSERQAETETQTAAIPAAEPSNAPALGNSEAFRSPSGERADSQAREKAALAADPTLSADAAARAESVPGQDERRLSMKEGPPSEQAAAALDANRGVLGGGAPLAAARAASAAAVFEVVSSDPLIRWRVGPGIVVQHSADGGSTWTPQQTAAPGPLTAGSSPSPSVCWLVGRAGAVVRSADGGRQWQQVKFPETADLVAVRASSATAATVDLVDGRRLATTDGGQTWTSVLN